MKISSGRSSRWQWTHQGRCHQHSRHTRRPSVRRSTWSIHDARPMSGVTMRVARCLHSTRKLKDQRSAQYSFFAYIFVPQCNEKKPARPSILSPSGSRSRSRGEKQKEAVSALLDPWIPVAKDEEANTFLGAQNLSVSDSYVTERAVGMALLIFWSD